jgi:DNA polymerase V
LAVLDVPSAKARLCLGSAELLGPLRLERNALQLPLAGDTVAAGFPSPADDYIDVGIDLNEALIRHPSSTFFLRVSGDSMTGAGIHHGDLLLVDRSLEPRPQRIVVAVLDGAFTLKRLTRHRGQLRLEAANPAYPPLELHQCGDVQIWGVAIHVIHPL